MRSCWECDAIADGRFLFNNGLLTSLLGGVPLRRCTSTCQPAWRTPSLASGTASCRCVLAVCCPPLAAPDDPPRPATSAGTKRCAGVAPAHVMAAAVKHAVANTYLGFFTSLSSCIFNFGSYFTLIFAIFIARAVVPGRHQGGAQPGAGRCALPPRLHHHQGAADIAASCFH